MQQAVMLGNVHLPEVIVKMLIKQSTVHVQHDGIDSLPGKIREYFCYWFFSVLHDHLPFGTPDKDRPPFFLNSSKYRN